MKRILFPLSAATLRRITAVCRYMPECDVVSANATEGLEAGLDADARIKDRSL